MKFFQKHRGFTLLETILAITILTMAITAAFELTRSSLAMGRLTLDQIVATHLAEEGLEIVRNMRDSNWLQNRPWQKGLSEGTYIIVTNNTPGNFPWSLEQRNEERKNNKNEKFVRHIEIKNLDGAAAMSVKSVVSYQERGGQKEVSLSMELTDWKKGPL